MNIQLTKIGQEHIRKIVDHYMPSERVHLNNDFLSKFGVDVSELSDDELYKLCQEKEFTSSIWFSLATLWEI